MNISVLYSCLKRLDIFPDTTKGEWANRVFHDYYLRKGYIPASVQALVNEILSGLPTFKFNPYHDPHNGEFTSGPGGLESDIDDPPVQPVYPVETALTVLLGGEVVAAARGAIDAAESAAAVDETSTLSQAGLTDHGAERVMERDITDDEVQQAIQTAQDSGNVTTQTGKYGTPQQVYAGSNRVTVIIETAGRNAGKIITLWRN